MDIRKVLFEDGLRRLSRAEVLSEMEKFYKDAPDAPYCFIVATDSQPHKKYVQYATSVILHRVGKGATFFIVREKVSGGNHYRARIWEEARRSIEMAQLFVPALPEHLGEDGSVEIHIDTSPAGKTRDMIRALVSFVEAQGFTARVKPDAPGVRVADKFSK